MGANNKLYSPAYKAPVTAFSPEAMQKIKVQQEQVINMDDTSNRKPKQPGDAQQPQMQQ